MHHVQSPDQTVCKNRCRPSPANEKSGGGRYQGEQSADFSSRGKVAERKCGLCFEQGGSRVEEEK